MARWMAVGMMSLLDCPRFAWSFGWTHLDPGAAPRSWQARLAMTSLAFMFDEVPDPVWNTSRGKWAS